MPDAASSKLNVPFDRRFYERLIAARENFSLVSSHVVPRGTGYAFRVAAGQTFRLTQLEAAQIVDTCIFSGDDPTEHHSASTQAALEGMLVTRLTRVWSTPPHSRPLCTCIADSVRPKPSVHQAREHACVGAHCNPHIWTLYTREHPRTCYDNLRAGLARIGFSQRFIHDNLNLFQNTAIDPITGDYRLLTGNSEAGDYIEFYAEMPLIVAISLCPFGNGSPVESLKDGVDTYPIQVDVYNSGVQPLG